MLKEDKAVVSPNNIGNKDTVWVERFHLTGFDLNLKRSHDILERSHKLADANIERSHDILKRSHKLTDANIERSYDILGRSHKLASTRIFLTGLISFAVGFFLGRRILLK